MADSRAQLATYRFHNVYTDMWVNVLFLDGEEWDEVCATQTTTDCRYGWTLPYDDEESATGIGLAFNVPMIVEQTRHLDDDQFNEYLDAIEYRLNNHITLYDDYDEEERCRIIDNLLYDRGPGSMQLLNDVQMRVLGD